MGPIGATLPDAAWTGMRGIAGVPECVVMQPTTLCNLACEYCYLPDRAFHRPMSEAIARATADAVNPWAAECRGFSVIWHGGEPLAAGRAVLADLMAPFVGVEHNVQTNATLINDSWCEFFRENDVRVSISVDGPAVLNSHRMTRGNTPAYKRIMKGVAALRRHELPFSALCVVDTPRPGLARELYAYFLDLGCDVLGISMEEHEGVNDRCTDRNSGAVRAFWSELLAAWWADPRIRIREMDHSLDYVAAVLAGTADQILPRAIDPMPMVAADGRVFVLSPELAGFSDPEYGDFSSGNILATPLPVLLGTMSASRGRADQPWIAEFLNGIEACRAGCPYFGFCGGAHAANRYFEHGRFDGTQTNHCRSSKIYLLQGVVDHLEQAVTGAELTARASTGLSGDSVSQRIIRLSDGLVKLLDDLAMARGGAAGEAGPNGTCGVGNSITGHSREGGSSSFYSWHNRPR